MIFGDDVCAWFGVMFFLIVGVSSLYNVYAASVNDGLVGRVLYLLTAVFCVVGLMQTGHVENATINAICWLFALRTLRNAVLKGVKHAI